jgi:aspartokinase
LRLPFFCRPFFPPEVALVNVDGAGMVGVPGVAARLFDRFHKAGVAVKLIAQVGRAHRAVAQTEPR